MRDQLSRENMKQKHQREYPDDCCCVFPMMTWKIRERHDTREKLVYATQNQTKINDRIGDAIRTVWEGNNRYGCGTCMRGNFVGLCNAQGSSHTSVAIEMN